MPRFDFFNNDYPFNEIIDGIIDGDMKNIKNDQDFLDFIIYYAFGKEINGEIDKRYEKYIECCGVLNFVLLDNYDLLDKKLYKLYEMCDKDKIKFIRLCHHIGQYGGFRNTFTKEEILTNLSLKEPVDFIDENLLLPNGENPEFSFQDAYYSPYNIPKNLYDEYNYELERSLIHRINESIKKNGDDIEPLEEMISYKEKEEAKRKKLEDKKVKDDYEININNIYYGKEILDLSGGVLNMNMQSVSWFENTNVRLLNYHAFRNVPSGDYCMLDNKGNIYIPNKTVSSNNISIGPDTPIRKVEIISVPKLFDKVIEKLEDDPIENESKILEYKGMLEMLNYKQKLSVKELNEYEPMIRGMYEYLFGSIFNSDNDHEKEISDEPRHYR